MLLAVLAVVVIAAAVVITVLVTKKAASTDAGRSGPVSSAPAGSSAGNPAGTPGGNPGGARPFPAPGSSTGTDGGNGNSGVTPTADAPTADAPTTDTGTTDTRPTDTRPTDTGTTGTRTSDPTTGGRTDGDRAAAYATASAFVDAVNHKSLGGVLAVVCRAAAAQTTQSQLDAIKFIRITGLPVLSGDRGTIQMSASTGSTTTSITFEMVVEDGSWKMCSG